MPATNGRGHILEAIMVWRWADCSAMQYLGHGEPFDWVAVVPAHLAGSRPGFVPYGARLHELQAGEEAWTW